MNNFIKVAQERSEILKFEHKVYCQECNELQFAPFDKLLVSAYGKCPGCADEKELEHQSSNIFQIL